MEELGIIAQKSSVESVRHVFSAENCGVNILDSGRTMSDFIDDKIKELSSKDGEKPFLVADLDALYEMHFRWLISLPRVKPFYAVKCNNTPAILGMLSALGTGFDCASKSEMQLALSLGVTPDRIIYAHTTKPTAHIKYARAHGVNTMTFDSEDELIKISRCHSKAKLVLRIAADDAKSFSKLSSKFGARLEQVGKLLTLAAELHLEVIGVSFHVGSGCTESSVFKQAIADARHVFDRAVMLGFQMNLLDIGGGFSGREDFPVKFEEFSEVINEALDEFFPPDIGVKIIAEPGRYFAETVFTLATAVIARRVITSVDEDKGNSSQMMMYYLNDGVYGSVSCLLNDAAHPEIKPYLHRAVESSEPRYQSVIWGPTCDSIDKVADNCWIPEVHIGDWILIDNMGAYTITSCTDFNGFERAQIYPVVSAKTLLTAGLSTATLNI
ncbi:ornithine decarboxylase-like [Nelusetta ayraudi]|uniref:ornithine decarboxylase-like n=1 Tax=Nelusetta ayraudi TaxID=303726 RepID=UPI003F72256A